MPELPDIVVYIEKLEERVLGRTLETVRVASPFVVRTYDPPIRECEGKHVVGLRRMGKRIVLGLEGDLFLVFHLMIAGRLHWKPRGARVPARIGLATFDFASGCLQFTEASTKKRAAIHVVRGEDALTQFDRGALEPLEASFEQFRDVLLSESHTLKRALTDPDLFSGIGNAFSDEILHRARLSPLRLTRQMDAAEVERLYAATRSTLTDWTERLRQEVGEGFPEKVTAFRDGMAVHGRHRLPCPDCGDPVQRIVHAENETNYCPGCQTGGRLLADRAMSRLLKTDWPRSLDEMDARLANGRQATRCALDVAAAMD
jgi:formamidopyrimidine-DNA glycosylase